MHLDFRNKYLSLIFTFLCIIWNCFALQSQNVSAAQNNDSEGRSEVKWIGQWPVNASIVQKKDLGKKIRDLITGKKPQDLKRPVSMVVGKDNSCWILDQESKAIFQLKDKEGKIPRYIENKHYNLASLVGICNFHDHEMLFTDSYLNKIFIINTESKECKGFSDSLKLNKPTGIAYSPIMKEIWLTETAAHRLLVLNENGQVIKTIGKRGSSNGEFNFPTHICIDSLGNVYVVDAMNFRVQVFNKDGVFISVFGKSGDATGYFASPKGIATDSYGNIYVADALFHVIQIFDIKGNFLYAFGSQGQGDGQFWMPSGIYIDKENKIFVADSYNSRIQIFQFIKGG